ncbi:hypothetical protein ACPFL9_19120 [Paenarthrobacter sp. NyZ202]|uniref:hypothetical protein n=1 Tax=Paenarthrobacter sp. NyZ202 TaxID=3402689 RepID=UPI003CF481BC
MSSEPTVNLELLRADAVVLFDWLMNVDLDAVPTFHPAEKQALADLLTCIETDTSVPEVTQAEIDAARESIGGNMGW